MKDKNTTALLALFLGGLGVHRFYLGQPGIGFLYLVFCWTFIPSVIGLIEFIVFLTMDTRAFNASFNKPIQNTGNYQQQIQHKPVNNLDELNKLHALLEKGAITQEEFDTMKAKLLT